MHDPKPLPSLSIERSRTALRSILKRIARDTSRVTTTETSKRCRVVPVLHAVCAAALAGGALAQQAGDDMIEWRAERPLEWSDFEGPVDPDAAPRTAASTASGIALGYEVQMEKLGNDCTFEITNVSTRATFAPMQSWVREGQQTASVLAHEQGHFDLTEIHRRMLERQLQALAGDERRCPGDAGMSQVQSMAAELAEPVRERIWTSMQQVQERYDAETEHGLDTAAQRDWEMRIEDALRRGRW